MERPLCRGVFAVIFLVAAYATQIGGRTAAADLTPEAGDGLQPLITTSELVVGENRFAFGLLKAGKLLEGADVKLRLYDIDGGEAKLAARAQGSLPSSQEREARPFGASPCGWNRTCTWGRLRCSGSLRCATKFRSGG